MWEFLDLIFLEQVRTKPPLPLSAMYRQSSVEVEEHIHQDFDHLIEQIQRSLLLLSHWLKSVNER